MGISTNFRMYCHHEVFDLRMIDFEYQNSSFNSDECIRILLASVRFAIVKVIKVCDVVLHMFR